MPIIDVNDFWTEALAGILAALVMLFIRPQWTRRPDKSKPSGEVPAGNRNEGGNQAIFAGGTINGGVRLKQTYTDNSQQTTIVHNLNSAPTPTSSSDDWGKIVVLVVLAIGAACLFVGMAPLLMVISFGAIAAVAVMTLVAAIRSHRMLDGWPRKSISVLVISGIACVTTAGTWWGSRELHRDGMSLDLIASSIPKITPKQSSSGIPGHLDYVISTVVPAFFGSGEYALHFVLFLMLGAFVSFMLTFHAWQQVHEWHSYLCFNISKQRSERTVKEAKSFQEGKVLPPMALAALFGAVAICCSLGIPFDLVHSTVERSTSSNVAEIGNELASVVD